MSKPMNPDPYDEALPDADDADFPIDEWSIDELDASADLSSLRSAWMGSHDRFD
jgi:hypothetical protein